MSGVAHGRHHPKAGHTASFTWGCGAVESRGCQLMMGTAYVDGTDQGPAMPDAMPAKA